MNRRGFITGLMSLVCAAPAIVSAPSLMPVRAVHVSDPDNIEAILKLLDRRIDEAHNAIALAMNQALYGGYDQSAIGLANLMQEPVKVIGIADSPYIRFGGFEPLTTLLAKSDPSLSWRGILLGTGSSL